MKKILSMIMACTFAVTGAGIAAHAEEKECVISDALKSAVGQYFESKLGSYKLSSGSCGIVDLFESLSNADFNLVIKNQDIVNPGQDDMPDEQKPQNTPEIQEPEKEQGGNAHEMTEAEKVVSLVNKYRAQNGLSAVSYDETLSLAASKRAKEQETLFSHTRPDGSRCFTVLSEYGIQYRGAGENIAMGQSDAQEVMNDWMNSEGHRANILGENYTKIGVGVHKGADGRLYWAQMFIY